MVHCSICHLLGKFDQSVYLFQAPPARGKDVNKNTLCQRRRRAAKLVAKTLESECRDQQIEAEGVMKLALKYLGLSEKFPQVVVYAGNTPLETRACVWSYWHEVS